MTSAQYDEGKRLRDPVNGKRVYHGLVLSVAVLSGLLTTAVGSGLAYHMGGQSALSRLEEHTALVGHPVMEERVRSMGTTLRRIEQKVDRIEIALDSHDDSSAKRE